MYFPARSFHAGSQLGATGQLVLGCLALLLASCGRNGTTNPDDKRIFKRMPERYRTLGRQRIFSLPVRLSALVPPRARLDAPHHH